MSESTESPHSGLDAAIERNRALGAGLKDGKTFRIQVHNGFAWYEVTAVGPTSAQVEWRDYGLDRTMDDMLGTGGEFPRRLIERLVRQHDVLEELFGEPD